MTNPNSELYLSRQTPFEKYEEEFNLYITKKKSYIIFNERQRFKAGVITKTQFDFNTSEDQLDKMIDKQSIPLKVQARNPGNRIVRLLSNQVEKSESKIADAKLKMRQYKFKSKMTVVQEMVESEEGDSQRQSKSSEVRSNSKLKSVISSPDQSEIEMAPLPKRTSFKSKRPPTFMTEQIPFRNSQNMSKIVPTEKVIEPTKISALGSDF